VCGRRAPLIGRVCMDQIMIDVTDIPQADMDSEVVLLGAQGGERITPDELAELAQTIPYEIMLGFGARVTKRETD
ncbi:MAG: alanine racemase, partial [Clostridia bacterium]|nr:alanine racemase [Clostridia bacterium]